MYDNIYGLSCIENQVLAILRNRGQKIALTYNDCAIPINVLYDIMVKSGVKQENLNHIKRVQDKLREFGIIDFTMKRSDNIIDLINAIRECGEDEYILIRVNEDFTKRVLRARGLRSDHFVLIKTSDGGFKVFNDIPENSVRIGIEQLACAFNKYFIKLRILRELDKNDADKLWKCRSYKPELMTAAGFGNNHIDYTEDIGIRIRNLAGVNKTLKHRMAEYYAIYTDTTFISRMLTEIDKLYAIAEYYILRRNKSAEKWESILKYLYSFDEMIFSRLKNELGEMDYERQNNRYFDGTGISGESTNAR